MHQALVALYTESHVNPVGMCLWPLVTVFVRQLPILWSPRNQTLPDRVAAILVVKV